MTIMSLSGRLHLLIIDLVLNYRLSYNHFPLSSSFYFVRIQLIMLQLLDVKCTFPTLTSKQLSSGEKEYNKKDCGGKTKSKKKENNIIVVWELRALDNREKCLVMHLT